MPEQHSHGTAGAVAYPAAAATAADATYDPTASGLGDTQVQAALDQFVAMAADFESRITVMEGA